MVISCTISTENKKKKFFFFTTIDVEMMME